MLELPASYLLAHTLGWGPQGLFYAITFAFCLLAVISAVMFRRGQWKLKAV